MAKVIKIEENIVTIEFKENEKREYLKDNFLNDIKVDDEVILRDDGMFVINKKEKKSFLLRIIMIISISILICIMFIFARIGYENGKSCTDSTQNCG